jgi:DNA-binding response OmpR family regulator
MGAMNRVGSRAIELVLVDSEPEDRQAAAKALQGRGFRVAQAHDGASALAWIHDSRPAAVVLDVGKDRSTALATLARIRAADPRLPVVMLTEEGETDIAMCGIELGAFDVLHKPADIDHLGSRIRSLVANGSAAAREKTIADLMVPASAYQRVYEDESIQQVIKVLTHSLFRHAPGKLTRQGHRSVLVYSREETFLGCIRLNDVLDLLIPPARKETYAPFEPGMFLARCKLLGTITAGEILGEQRFVEIEAPLMEAVQLMVVDSLINIPVLKQGELVGILTDRNLLLEIHNLATGGV